MEQVVISLWGPQTEPIGKRSEKSSVCPASFLKESVFSIPLPCCPKEQRSSKIEYHSFSVLPAFVPFAPIKIHAESWVTGLQTHTGQFGFNLIPPGPPLTEFQIPNIIPLVLL